MGEKRKRHGSGDSLRWYEILTCCCKWGNECRTCVAATFVYLVPIIFLILLTAASITIGAVSIHFSNCSYKSTLPWWVVISGVTPYPLLVFIKAVKEKYNGITCLRAVFLLYYIVFAAWMVIGSIWIYETWANACDDCCNKYVKTYAFALTFAHWLVLALATIPLVYILTKICCCCSDNATDPLKAEYSVDDYIM